MRPLLAPALLALSLLAAPLAEAPAAAQAATPAQQKEAAAFVEQLANEAFAVLRDKSLSKADARARFRTLLRENFAVDTSGMRLIRKHRAGLTPAQLQAYREALPGFFVNTYADRLYDFADSKVTVIRQVPRGTRGDVDVHARVTDPAGGRPFDTIWQVTRSGDRWLIANLTVSGVNIALTQEADFDAYIQRNGFDALVDFMRQTQ
ncbi:MAG: ABC transporter substrate-binding protein [Sphingomonadaceae bacterium]